MRPDHIREIIGTRPKILFGTRVGDQANYNSVWARYDYLVSVFPEHEVAKELSEYEFFLLRMNVQQCLQRTAAVA